MTTSQKSNQLAGLPSLPHTSAPTIFVDGFVGMSLVNDVLKINLIQVVQDVDSPEAPPVRQLVARLAMSPQTLRQFVDWVGETHLIDEARTEENGSDKS